MNIKSQGQTVLFWALLGWFGSFAAAAWAEKADHEQPVYINAANVRLDDVRKLTIYEGQVVLTRGSMQLEAERIEVSQDASGFTFGSAFGQLAHFRQKEDGTGHIVEGWGERIDYDGRTEIIKITGQSRLQRGNLQEMHSNSVTYDMRSQVYQARGSNTGTTAGRVIAVIQSQSAEKTTATPTEKTPPAASSDGAAR